MKHLTRWQESICIWHFISNGLVRRRSFLEGISQKKVTKCFLLIIRYLFHYVIQISVQFFVFNQISEATLIYESFLIFGCSILNHILFFTTRRIVPKKWQEILNKIGLIFAHEIAVDFSSLYVWYFLLLVFFFLFFFSGLQRKLARDSRKFLVTFFFFFSSSFLLLFLLTYFIFTTRRIVSKSDKKYKASSVCLSKMR